MDIKNFDQNGFAIVRELFDAEELSNFHRHFEATMKRHNDTPPQDWNFWLFDDDKSVLDIISHPKILDVVENVLGPNIVHIGSHYWVKPPKVGKKVSWHQDGAYYELSHNNMVTVWIALDNSDKKNGCLKVVPGTHLADYLELEPVDNDPYLKRKIKTLPFDTSQEVALELAAGDISLHHPNILHGSDENLSNNWRRGFVIKYIAGDVDILCEQKWPWAMLVRGKCESEITSEQLVSSF
ncbi:MULTISPECIES: phytanoyl-CoA dioxygenase family protein [unclassified Vibrio]|uniref:phytanoyl-CoA dioxygenase family protein n=1 Tax=unclassified Vibrio TaxID=2614977 RepID=UPI001361BDFD|nr:hypothetical protein [Vibrio sp. V36_P2S2PM302]NAX27193.1 hypothetical protein [Vibrio sp. V38_P2S17PM301]